MTKTEYQGYIASADWQERRKEFLLDHTECERCSIPRWLAEVAYNNDLHVHHKSYANLGNEDWEDLEALCRRCHEIEKFGRSDLREPKTATCTSCENIHWNPYSNICGICDHIFSNMYNFCKHCTFRYLIDPDAVDINTCDACSNILSVDLRRIWHMCDKSIPTYGSVTAKDLIVGVLSAKFGENNILDALIKTAKFSEGYKKDREMETIREEEALKDIPF